MCGILAMQWVDIFGQYIEPDDGNPVGRLIAWIVTYLVICGFLYVLAASDTKFTAPPKEALAWFLTTVACGFCASVLPDDVLGHASGVAILLAEQLVFYAIWLLPRTMEMGIQAWNIKGVRLAVPGCTGGARKEDSIAQWRADCDSILWGAASFALAANGLRMLKTAVTREPYCPTNDRCSWDTPAEGTFWLQASVALMLVTAICVRPLVGMKDGGGLKNIVATLLISALPTTVAMSLLNVLRFQVQDNLCKHLEICDADHDVFLYLMVAYASTCVAMVSAVFMSYADEIFTGIHWRTILQYCQGAVGTQAGFAWFSVFSAASTSGALDVLFRDGTEFKLALLLTVTIGPLYVYYIRPENDRVHAAKAAKAHSD